MIIKKDMDNEKLEIAVTIKVSLSEKERLSKLLEFIQANYPFTRRLTTASLARLLVGFDAETEITDEMRDYLAGKTASLSPIGRSQIIAKEKRINPQKG